VIGEAWFNQAEGRPAADPAVRLALTQGLDLGQLADVITAGRGGPGTSFAASGAAACPGDSVSGALPEFDPDAAAAALDAAGWTAGSGGTRSKDGTPLALTFVYDTGLGTSGAAAAELVGAAWTELGVDVTTTPQDETAVVETVFSTGDWDYAWVPVNVSSPDQMVPFLSGPAVPEGNNFASISNADYEAGVAEAMTMTGTEGCDTWLEAESALVRDADVIPFANQVASFFGSGAEFAVIDVLQPTSIRMLG
jgi:peptide/nickel transport system substrate-binding protein